MSQLNKRSQSSELSRMQSDVLQIPAPEGWTVGRIERSLLQQFPANEAEPWDRMGLIVGDPSQAVTGVAIALDPTIDAVRACDELGGNVLLTHHPVFIEPPSAIQPASAGLTGPGTVIWEALSRNIALINVHTALDVSAQASRLLPSMLHLDFQGILDVSVPDTGHGYGQRCSVRPDDDPLTLQRLGARVTSVFGRQPRMWGSEDAQLRSIVTCTGSQGGLARLCVAQHIDALVCGEIRYHDALEAASAGLCILELGHDVSELPLCAVLMGALIDAGYPEFAVRVIDQSFNWTTPEAIRK